MGNKSSNHEYAHGEMPQKARRLHYAVLINDKETVRTLVKEGVNVNSPWYNPSNPSIKDGSTPLIWAVTLNNVEIIEILLKAGAYINKCDRNGMTPICKAAFHGIPMLIELLSKSGADVNLSDYNGRTPLYFCVNNAIVHSSSCKLAVSKLLINGAIVDKCDKIGQAPVHAACHWKLTDILVMLISSKCDVNLTDKRGRTPLYVCVSSLSTNLYFEDLQHQLPCILTLFAAGADMLNLVEWILFKGPGIPKRLLEDTSQEFQGWYRHQTTRPQTLKNISRKAVQKALVNAAIGRPVISVKTTQNGSVRDNGLVFKTRKLPLPDTLQKYVARKMFFHPDPVLVK